MTRTRDFAIRMALAFIAACGMAVCSRGPSETQVESDFRAIHPGCSLASAGAGEGDADHVYVEIEFRCGGKDKRAELLYQRIDGQWKISGP